MPSKKRKKVEVIFGPKTTSKTQTILFTPSPRLVGKNKRTTGNELRRRICLYPLLLFQIFKKLQFVEKQIGTKMTPIFLKNHAFRRSQEFLSVIGRFLVENHCLQFVCFISTILGEGVNESKRVFEVDLGPKMTSHPLRFFEFRKKLASIFFSRIMSFGGAGNF